MIARIGIGVSRNSVRAVLVRGGQVAWSATAPVAAGELLRDVLVRLLAEVPRTRWERVRLLAAIGPAAAQAKRLSGLPPLKSQRDLTEMLSANAGRFFLRNGVPLQLTALHVLESGDVWGGAIEAPVVEDIAAAAALGGVRFESARPSVAVLPYALRDDAGEARWSDGETCAEVTILGRGLAGVRRLSSATGMESCTARPAPPLHPALAALGESGWAMADAFGAAVAPARAPLALRARAAGHGGTDAGRRALAAAALLVVLAAGSALFVPALTAAHAAARATERAGELRLARQELARTRGLLAQGATTLGHASAFAARRRSMLGLLSGLSFRIPDSTALVSLRVDSVGGSFTAVTPSAADVLPSLAEVAGIASAAISSPVTSEAGGAGDLERVSIAFRRTASGGAAAPPRAPARRSAQ